jgi:hypothetical protein
VGHAPARCPPLQGPAKTISVTPVVGGWVRGQKRTRIRLNFNSFFHGVFELPHRETPKKMEKKIGFGFFVDFFWLKTFRHDFVCKTFFVVFLNSHR